MHVGTPKEFDVLTSGAGGRGKVDVDVISPSRAPVKAKVKDMRRGKHVEFTPKEEGNKNKVNYCFAAWQHFPVSHIWFLAVAGPYEIDVKYDDVPVEGSPFTVDAIVPADASKVRAYGPGLSEGVVGKPAPFTIETKDAGGWKAHESKAGNYADESRG